MSNTDDLPVKQDNDSSARVPPRRRPGRLIKWLLPLGILAALLAFAIWGGEDIGKPSPADEWKIVDYHDDGPGMDSGRYSDLDFVDGQHGWAVRMDRPGVIMGTTDGEHWEPVVQDGIQVDFATSTSGWLRGSATALARTTDGGLHWEVIPVEAEPPSDIRALAAVSEAECWLLTDSGRLLHTTDRGRHWVVVPHPLSDLVLEMVFFLDRQHGWILAWEPQRLCLLRTTDGGRSFASVVLPSVTTGTLSSGHIYFRTPREGWLAVGGPDLLHTTDGGETWQRVRPLRDLLGNTAYNDCCFVTPREGWAVGKRGGSALAVHTRDGGRTWRRSYTGVETVKNSELWRVVFVDRQHGWVTGEAGVIPSDLMPWKPGHQVTFLLRYGGD